MSAFLYICIDSDNARPSPSCSSFMVSVGSFFRSLSEFGVNRFTGSRHRSRTSFSRLLILILVLVHHPLFLSHLANEGSCIKRRAKMILFRFCLPNESSCICRTSVLPKASANIRKSPDFSSAAFVFPSAFASLFSQLGFSRTQIVLYILVTFPNCPPFLTCMKLASGVGGGAEIPGKPSWSTPRS